MLQMNKFSPFSLFLFSSKKEEKDKIYPSFGKESIFMAYF